ncbi:hypothetical protein AchV4_0053 [Achromobacter phage vB_AchrS_AchV4]|uniref:Uncharacterized protein n=1 Tax=Achromobacter phage vB_AchrS_AchV4 TaxID=2796514 RepID=A0A7T3U6U9_9CAUD|nr:hypothetical protein JT316_gp53 [Achromobacter phage vB_AchrS_AchV4]QPZ53260.1 hypothetical protein AchV4_0053 [Achromobacter phage vB_AchrS_AchV4]
MAKPTYYNDGDTFEHKGRTFRVFIEYDDDGTPPWERADGHGPVSDWTSRDKRPGEWVLSSDRGSKRFYDAQEAARLARVDGWGLDDNERARLAAKLGREPKPGEVRAEAVRRDFEFLRRWCADQWHYVGVAVVHVPNGTDPDEVKRNYSYAVWGIESDADEYIVETASECADECAHALDAEAATIRAKLRAQREAVRALIADIRQSATLRPAVCAAVRESLTRHMEKRAAEHARLAELAGA